MPAAPNAAAVPAAGAFDRWLLRMKLGRQGWLRNSPLVAELAGAACAAGSLLPGIGEARRLRLLADACRFTSSDALRAMLASRIRPTLAAGVDNPWRRHRIGWGQYAEDFARHDERTLSATVLLKAPGAGGERGVIYSSFEYNWIKLANHPEAARIFANYSLVGASSWSPGNYGLMASLGGLADGPVYMGISNDSDLRAYRVLSPVIEPLGLLASDWINPELYAPRPREQREIDILMVANWLPFKRHWLLFEALRKMPADLRVVLVGIRAPGRDEMVLRAEADAFGVRQRLEFFSNITIDEVTRLQCNAKIATIFSHREGSCVAVAESLFADTPVAMMSTAHIGSKKYINAATGALVDRSSLATDLLALLEKAPGMRPRAWALENTGCAVSTRALNGFLRERAIGEGRPWSADIAALCWRPMPKYVEAADSERLGAAREQFTRQFGFTFADERR